MVTQYPHSIEVEIPPVLVKDDENNWTPSTTEPEKFISKCRAEINISRASVNGADGSEISFNYNVFLPKTSFKGPVGTNVALTVDNEILNLQVYRWQNNQMNSVIWL